jgi:predicted RNA binding protein YcfA (HicA-like mRNA interferase family)
MPKLSPVSWQDFVRRMRALGFEGPFAGGKHPYMVRGNLVLTIPNPHRREIGVALLSRILREASISHQEWNQAK